MKKILVILSHANLNHLNCNESISALMVLATFGHEIQVLLTGAGLSLLKDDIIFNKHTSLFKPASNMVESFEFYDLLPILIEQKDQYHPFVLNTQLETKVIELNSTFIQSYQHILYW